MEGCYQGIIERWHRATKSGKEIKEYPELALGNVPKDFKYRFNWNAPILSAPTDSNTIYHAGNVVFKTQNGGIDWEVISPDLTRNNKAQQIPGGTPFTNEAAGGENYNTLMSLATSPHSPEVLWAGSDDGLIHITQDGGKNWKNVTPKGLEEGIINSIEVSPHDEATAYITLMRYKFMDLTPYIYKTKDFGATWELITEGISGGSYLCASSTCRPQSPRTTLRWYRNRFFIFPTLMGHNGKGFKTTCQWSRSMICISKITI